MNQSILTWLQVEYPFKCLESYSTLTRAAWKERDIVWDCDSNSVCPHQATSNTGESPCSHLSGTRLFIYTYLELSITHVWMKDKCAEVCFTLKIPDTDVYLYFQKVVLARVFPEVDAWTLEGNRGGAWETQTTNVKQVSKSLREE